MSTESTGNHIIIMRADLVDEGHRASHPHAIEPSEFGGCGSGYIALSRLPVSAAAVGGLRETLRALAAAE